MKLPPILAVNPRRDSLAFCTMSEVTTWDLEARRPVKSFEPGIIIFDAAIIPGSPLIALAGGALELWDLESGKKVDTLPNLTENWLARVVVTSDSRYLGFSSFFRNYTIPIYDLQERSIVRILQGHYNDIHGLTTSYEGGMLISVEAGAAGIIAWDLATGTKIWEQPGRGFEFIITPTTDDRLLVSSPSSYIPGLIILSDLKTGEKLEEWKGHRDEVTDLAVAMNNLFWVSCSEDHSLKVWNMANLEVIASFEADAPWRCCRVVNNDRMIVAGDDLERLYFLELDPSGQILQHWVVT